MSGFAIRGWCPGALRPMASGDGLVVRVRVPFGRLSATQAKALALASRDYGNGQMEISNRGNLQIRGVDGARHLALLDVLAGLGLLDADVGLETKRNILLAPYWSEGDEAQVLVGQMLARLAELPDLPGKFGSVVDLGAARVLADAPGDLRFERGISGGMILRADGHDLGRPVTPATAVEAWIALARDFVAAGGVVDGRGRMRALVARGFRPEGAVELPAVASDAAVPGLCAPGVLVGFEFGSFPAETLAALADLGMRCG